MEKSLVLSLTRMKGQGNFSSPKKFGSEAKRPSQYFANSMAGAVPVRHGSCTLLFCLERRQVMNSRTYALSSAVIFLIVALAHLLRCISGTEVLIGSWHVPLWVSIVAVVVAGFLSFQGFRLYRQGQWFSWLR